jgi:hypothetical protein
VNGSWFVRTRIADDGLERFSKRDMEAARHREQERSIKDLDEACTSLMLRLVPRQQSLIKRETATLDGLISIGNGLIAEQRREFGVWMLGLLSSNMF